VILEIKKSKDLWALLKPRVKGILILTYPGLVSWIHLFILALWPNNFTRRIAQKMMWDRNPQQTLFADKYQVRNFVSDRIGPEYLSKILWAGTYLETLNKKNLPDKYVIKPNHGSHAAILVSPEYELKNKLPKPNKSTGWNQYFIHPDSLNLNGLNLIIKYWLSINYYKMPNKFHEWAYKNIYPMIIIEEFLQGENGLAPDEYRFFMFNGECDLVYCYKNRFNDDNISLMDPKGKVIAGRYLGLESTSNFQTPKEFGTMLELSKKLSRGVNFVRVDLYLTDNGIIFSELTNYPMGALSKFYPKNLNKQIGKKWKI
jgi:hypothetical protein